MSTNKLSQKELFSTLWDVVVVGGGPAGMMAALTAAARGRKVLLLEKNETLGKKLLISGGGRCNITNNTPEVRAILAKYKEAGKFLFSTFSQFAVTDTITFFEEKKVLLKEENERRMFPVSNTALSVQSALVDAMKKHGVAVQTRSVVSSIVKDATEKNFTISLKTGESIIARTCVVATGGTSHPETGSTGEGFAWLKKLGHTVIENNFALVPIALKDTWVKKLGGVTLPQVTVTIFSDAKKVSSHSGKLLFTHFGITGPTVLNMSSEVGDLLAHSSVTLSLDLVPNIPQDEIRKKITELFKEESNKKVKNVLGVFMPAALIAPFLAIAQVDGDTPNHSVTTLERARIAHLLKAVPLTVKGLLGADKAVISAGGVALPEVHFKTMESRIVSGLYLVGDVLNINRPSGGYSLQLCWSTGFVAGSSIP
ncbi:NAD(P)/FAD-dependent oxidoreductase [Patescibacteria group bacterium]|nr:NAD(P)/FAD-dependent oxidoreductase [Patescibacteria group bacterium]